jgi:hypothetical protein
MRSAARNAHLGSLVAQAILGIVIASGVCRAEVGTFWTPAQPTAHLVGYKWLAIGDDPDPINQIWRQYSVPGTGRAVLNPEGDANGDGMPSMLIDPGSGLLAVAWARNSATGFDVVISRFDAGAWTTPQVVAGTSANELDPQLVLDADGSVHLFYWVDGASPRVFHRQAPADLSSWSAPLLVSHPGQSACRPAGVVFQGVLRVAYEVHDFGFGNAPRQIVLARFTNGAFVTEVVSITNNLGNVSPEVHAHGGRLWVDWVDAETSGGSGEVAWIRLNPQGHWESIHYESFVNREQRDFLVRGGVRMRAIE